MKKKVTRLRVPATQQFSTSIHPLLQRIYAHRGLNSDDQVDLSLKHLLLAETLKGLPEALALLQGALEQRKRILIVGVF